MSYDSATTNARAWVQAGLTHHRSGRLEGAVHAYREALAVSPDDGDALNLLGTALLQLGALNEALGYLERAARKQRNNPLVLANLAQAYMAAQRYGDAYEGFRKANRLDPHELQFQLGMAAALALLGKLSEAEVALTRLASRFPNSPLVWFNLGNALRDQRRIQEAIGAYEKALVLDANFAEAINNLGSVFQSSLKFAEAEERYRHCLTVEPDHLRARFNLASVVMDLGRFVEAEAISRELVMRAPEAAEGWTILGAALGHQGRLPEALTCYKRAAELDPKNPKVLETYAAVLTETNHVPSGLRGFYRAHALSSEPHALNELLGIALLASGCLQDGWRHYRNRPAARRFREKYPHLELASRLPAELAGKHICVLREQGLGDELFFLRYAVLLAARGARITYRASAKLVPLLTELPWIDALLEEVSDLPQADINILLGDLPHALGELAATALPLRSPQDPAPLPDFPYTLRIFWPDVPASISLVPEQSRVAELHTRLAAAGPPPYIGVTWRAGTAPEDQNSVTWLLYKTVGLELLGETLRDTAGTLVALQRQPRAGELEAFMKAVGRPVADFTAFNDDLGGMLALLSLLDDYVGVSNTNMHLRVALGQTARVLVPNPAEWRWMGSGRSSPWFPGFSIYRQSLNGEWTAALDSLKRDLQVNYGRGTRSNSAELREI